MSLNPAQSEDERSAWLQRSQRAWNDRAAGWDTMLEEDPERRQRELEQAIVALQLAPALRVLDAGCGTGQWAVGFAAFGCDVTAVDLAPEMLDRARAHADQAGVSIRFREGDLAVNDDPDHTYDAIHCRCALQFHPDPAATLREFQRLLVPGGRLFVSVPGALSPIYAGSWRRFLGEDTFNNRMVPWELEALLHELGWVVLGGWGVSGTSGEGIANDLMTAVDGEEPPALPEPVQQAVSIFWVTIAAVPVADGG